MKKNKYSEREQRKKHGFCTITFVVFLVEKVVDKE